jgi:hypothetical protein
MTQEEILEGNKLIAEFMGAKLITDDPNFMGGNVPFFRLAKFNDIERNYTKYELKYHSSWDWLMPVVEKIEKELFWQIELYRNQCKIWHETDGKTLWRETESKIQSTWLAVVEFIKWENKNKQS